MKTFQGVYTALITPFMDNGEIDWNAYESLIIKQIKHGTQGIVVCGTTAETPTLTEAERKKLIKTAVNLANKQITVIAGTGSNCTKKTIEESEMALGLGCDALLVVVPYYNKPTPSGVLAHFKEIANNCSGPIILYNVPSRTITNLQPSTVAELCSHSNIVGIKDATGDMSVLTELRTTVLPLKPSFTFLSGDDPTLFAFMNNGGHGVISVGSNVMPTTFSRICSTRLSQDSTEIFKIFEKSHRFLRLLFSEPNPIPIKALMAKAGHIKNNLRLPLVPMTTNAFEALYQEFLKLPETIREEILS
jgi:4-hydroxy-tetrahydrodipicolinate synthase